MTVVSLAFTAMVTISCGRHILSNGLKEDFAVFKGRKFGDWCSMIFGAIFILSSVMILAENSSQFPHWIRFSWTQLLDSSKEGTNLNLSGASVPVFGLFFVVLLILNLPRLAHIEEDVFREGTKDWLDAIPRSLKFGLMHMIVGVPLWVGLFLAIPGMWFTFHYFKGGVSRSTMAHATYNLIIGTILFFFVLESNLN